jgi:CheY-like chemotaxis protein
MCVETLQVSSKLRTWTVMAQKQEGLGHHWEKRADAMTFAATLWRLHGIASLIVDVRMPKMGGFELQRRIVASGHVIPNIFLTAFAPNRATFYSEEDKDFTDYPAWASCRYPRQPGDIS